LSPEKRPGRSVDALATLREQGVDAVLVVAGDGPLRRRLLRRTADLPIDFVNFVPDRKSLAALLATADVVIAPGPIETFGLAAVESLACGTPVVVDATSALPEVVGDAGVGVFGDGYGAGVAEILARPEQARRDRARARAEQFAWPAAVAGFLRVHALEAPALAQPVPLHMSAAVEASMVEEVTR